MQALKTLSVRLLEFTVASLVAVLVLVVLWGVASRFILSIPSPWVEELATHLLAWVALLGAAIGFRQQQHLGVDFFAKKLHPAAQRVLAMIVQLLVIVFAASVMLWGGTMLVSQTLASGQVTPSLNIPMGYVYLCVPASGLFIVLFSLEQLYTSYSERVTSDPSQNID